MWFFLPQLPPSLFLSPSLCSIALGVYEVIGSSPGGWWVLGLSIKNSQLSLETKVKSDSEVSLFVCLADERKRKVGGKKENLINLFLNC